MRARTIVMSSLFVLASCGGGERTMPNAAAPPAPVATSGGQASAGPAWTYEVKASPGGEELVVDAVFAAGTHEELSVEEGGEPFVRDVQANTGSGFAPVAMRDASWFLPTCARGCAVHYRVDLAGAAKASGRVTVGRARRGAVESPPSTWLLRPIRAERGTPFRFHVATAPGETFVTGVFPSKDGAPDTYEGKAGASFQLPYSAIGPVRLVPRGHGVNVAFLPGKLKDEAAVLAWVDAAARAVAGFYGKFPVPRLMVIVRPVRGDSVGFGTAIGNAGAAISIDVGEDSTAEDFKGDWVLVHEMIHTALPDLEGPHHWLEEGLSTYVEPLARARAGTYAESEVWKDWVKSMPNGEPEAGDQGLDVTHTWGRTYWGGALFCLVVDLEIRSRTHGAKSLDDALRAVVAEGGNISTSWPIKRVIEVGDAATGVPVLAEMYAKMATSPSPVDLAAIWKQLGVERGARGEIAFDDTAPMAKTRQAMTKRRN